MKPMNLRGEAIVKDHPKGDNASETTPQKSPVVFIQIFVYCSETRPTCHSSEAKDSNQER